MSARIEAQRLSGVDLGKTVTLPDGAVGRVVAVEHGDGPVRIAFQGGTYYRRWHWLQSTDLVTVEGVEVTVTVHSPSPEDIAAEVARFQANERDRKIWRGDGI